MSQFYIGLIFGFMTGLLISMVFVGVMIYSLRKVMNESMREYFDNIKKYHQNKNEFQNKSIKGFLSDN